MNRVQNFGCCDKGDGTNQERNTFGWIENMPNWQNTDTNANTNTNTNANTNTNTNANTNTNTTILRKEADGN